MEVKKVDLAYKDEFITALLDHDEFIILCGERVNHFDAHKLEDWIKMGLMLEAVCGTEKREHIQDSLLEIWYEYELKNKFINKDEKTKN